MEIEVAFALEKEQSIIKLDMPENSTISQAIKNSGILLKYPQIDLNKNLVGIFSKTAKLTDILREKDRIEIYRPLIADPKEVRKRKALKDKNKKNDK